MNNNEVLLKVEHLCQYFRMGNRDFKVVDDVSFEVKKGEVIEMYATTLHFCPIETNPDGFGCVVILPVGTKTVLDEPSTDEFLFKKNKWIMAHNDNAELISKGVKPGIYGENYTF